MATQKFYQDMSADEQLQWVTEFGELMAQHEAMIIAVGKRQQTMTLEGAKAVQRVFALLAAWPFAQDFCEKAQKYGDYSARTYRLPVYIEKVRELLSAGLTMTDSTGRVVAYVSPSVPLRRRGRPTKEETAARLRGEAIAVQEGDDAEAKKRRAIAKMLGLEVIVSGEAPREKNNAELKAEREAKRAMEEKMNPSLFDKTPSQSPRGEKTEAVGEAANAQTPPLGEDGRGLSPCAQLMNDSYEARMAQDKLHLDQLAWLMSKPLQERVKLVQSQRTAAESASERAKMLAEMNGKQEEIAEYAEQAKVATEAYLATYSDVDEELAVVFYRLQNDEPFREKFVNRFRGVDLVRVSHICRPYYEKLRSPELDIRIKAIIEQESPEYAAKMRAEQAKREEVADILRYLKRKDKDASDTRLKTAKEVKFPRLVELIGEEEAKDYLPLISYIEEENRKWREANGKSTDTDAEKTAEKKAGKKESKADDKKATKPSTKQESKKSTKAQSKKKDEQ